MMIELWFVAFLLAAAPLLIWRESVSRFFHALGLGIAWAMAERAERAMHKRSAPREIETATHEAVLHAKRGRAHADIRV